MSGNKLNKDGTVSRKRTDNYVRKSGGQVFYKGNSIVNANPKEWILNGQRVGSLSGLSQTLRGLVREPQFNLTTYAIGEYLEENGYVFAKPFRTNRPATQTSINSNTSYRKEIKKSESYSDKKEARVAERNIYELNTVNNWTDIFNNIQRLEKYRTGTGEDKEFFLELIKKGTCFVVTEIDGRVVFAPSRFIGYQDNTREKHIVNKTKDGRITNPEIEKITNSKFQVNEGLERAYRNFCLSFGFNPRDKGSFGVTRKYIAKDLSAIVPDDFIMDDLIEVQNQKNISETEKKQLVNARLGQGDFRESLLKYWKGCSCTGCKERTMLRASHIKPWRLCNNEERLDNFNGLLLIPNIDLAFDNGLISFENSGNVIISEALSATDSKILGITTDICVKLHQNHQPYMQYHRENIFRK